MEDLQLIITLFLLVQVLFKTKTGQKISLSWRLFLLHSLYFIPTAFSILLETFCIFHNYRIKHDKAKARGMEMHLQRQKSKDFTVLNPCHPATSDCPPRRQATTTSFCSLTHLCKMLRMIYGIQKWAVHWRTKIKAGFSWHAWKFTEGFVLYYSK